MLVNNTYNELELLTQKIETNTADLKDYQRYEILLQNGGLSKEYIYSYLNRAGFNDWNELLNARKEKERAKDNNAKLIGGIIGLGLGILIAKLFSEE
ncbi:hypothetical protein [Aestuariibaculum suncheonense]|uniref:Uncharacterized protein n=1 Tax=Aestuariibaculum suncheonense TaxID=1028745 RepID=A0A8J6U9U3_9FLAO|nr:hypothetical protein [Aestuariibaculum suncheonense]MBD0834478.1 hypothetical protein [Aestuariibaculum suncheonense]